MKNNHLRYSREKLDQYRQALRELNKNKTYKDLVLEIEAIDIDLNGLSFDENYLRNFARGKTGNRNQGNREKAIMAYIDKYDGNNELLRSGNNEKFDRFNTLEKVKFLSKKNEDLKIDISGFYIGFEYCPEIKNYRFFFLIMNFDGGYLNYRSCRNTKNKPFSKIPEDKLVKGVSIHEQINKGLGCQNDKQVLLLGNNSTLNLKFPDNFWPTSYLREIVKLKLYLNDDYRHHYLLGYKTSMYPDTGVYPCGIAKLDRGIFKDIDIDFNFYNLANLRMFHPNFYAILSCTYEKTQKETLQIIKNINTKLFHKDFDKIIEWVRNKPHQNY